MYEVVPVMVLKNARRPYPTIGKMKFERLGGENSLNAKAKYACHQQGYSYLYTKEREV